MRIGRLSIRINSKSPKHHLWCNNGSWWVAYVLHFSGRKRRIRRSLGTRCVEDAIRRRDELFARIERDGEEVPERQPKGSNAVEGERDMPPSNVMPCLPVGKVVHGLVSLAKRPLCPIAAHSRPHRLAEKAVRPQPAARPQSDSPTLKEHDHGRQKTKTDVSEFRAIPTHVDL